MNAILIFPGLFNGIFVVKEYFFDSNTLFTGLSVGLMIGFLYAVAIYTFVTVYKRFKKSMFGN